MSESELEVLEMVVIEPSTVLAAYTNGEGLDDAIDQVKTVVQCFEHDLSTKTGRAKTASLAHKVAKVKTKLDSMGKELVAGWKDQARKVDSSRKSMREALDELKIEARKPLTEWEMEQAEIEAERLARAEAEALANQIESDHEIAILMNDKIERDAADARAEEERQAKAAAEQAERDRKIREARIATEAAERATRKANEQAAQKEAEAAQAIKEAQEAGQRARWEHEESLKQAEAQKIQAVKDAEAKAEREAQAKEEDRLDEEARIAEEQAKREANKNHRRKINNAVLTDLVKAGLDETTGKHLIRMIIAGQIAHTSISY